MNSNSGVREGKLKPLRERVRLSEGLNKAVLLPLAMGL